MELENALMAHPRVSEAAVIGVPDERWGERPMAAVVLTGGDPVPVAELREFLGERVPRWQLPERWAFITEVPKTSVGKFAKTVMRDAYARGDYEVIEAR
jgi:fatty-acyl-CoA synthase